jgi:hypothetical protein
VGEAGEGEYAGGGGRPPIISASGCTRFNDLGAGGLLAVGDDVPYALDIADPLL